MHTGYVISDGNEAADEAPKKAASSKTNKHDA